MKHLTEDPKLNKSLEQINEDYYKELGELLLLTDDAPEELCIFVKKIDENGFDIIEKKNTE